MFRKPDALATGKTEEELKAQRVPDKVIPHKVMTGNRPSNVLLLPHLNAYAVGQLLALYEHRTAVQGFVWGLNSFDQMGVELGKVGTLLFLLCSCLSSSFSRLHMLSLPSFSPRLSYFPLELVLLSRTAR